MKLRSTLAAAAIAAATLIPAFVVASPAGAVPFAPPDAKVAWAKVSPGGQFAYVLAGLKCSGGQADPGPHLWVSVKQGGPDASAEGSGDSTTSWYDDHPTPIPCDGKWHSHLYKMVLHGDKSPATAGRQAWVQFCLFDNQGNPMFVQQWMNLGIYRG
jgi:hypothetical protein